MRTAALRQQRPTKTPADLAQDRQRDARQRGHREPVPAVTVQPGWEPEGLREKVGSAVGADSRQVEADAQRFKKFIEERGSETGAWRGEVEIPENRV